MYFIEKKSLRTLNKIPDHMMQKSFIAGKFTNSSNVEIIFNSKIIAFPDYF